MTLNSYLHYVNLIFYNPQRQVASKDEQTIRLKKSYTIDTVLESLNKDERQDLIAVSIENLDYHFEWFFAGDDF